MKRFKVRILPVAHNDLTVARNWYRQHNPYLPKRLKQQVQLAISRIRETPSAHAVRYKEVRIANINVFPYAIHYLLKDDTIIIIAIHHTAISPKKWQDRI